MKSSQILSDKLTLIKTDNQNLYKNYTMKHKKVNKDIAEHVKYIDPNEWREELWVALDGNKIVGAIGTQKSPLKDEPDTYWLKYVSVHTNYRGQGIARALTREFFKDAANRSYKIENSNYSEIGQQYLPEMNQELAKEFNVIFTEGHTWEFIKKNRKLDVVSKPTSNHIKIKP